MMNFAIQQQLVLMFQILKNIIVLNKKTSHYSNFKSRCGKSQYEVCLFILVLLQFLMP